MLDLRRIPLKDGEKLEKALLGLVDKDLPKNELKQRVAKMMEDYKEDPQAVAALKLIADPKTDHDSRIQLIQAIYRQHHQDKDYFRAVQPSHVEAVRMVGEKLKLPPDAFAEFVSSFKPGKESIRELADYYKRNDPAFIKWLIANDRMSPRDVAHFKGAEKALAIAKDFTVDEVNGLYRAAERSKNDPSLNGRYQDMISVIASKLKLNPETLKNVLARRKHRVEEGKTKIGDLELDLQNDAAVDLVAKLNAATAAPTQKEVEAYRAREIANETANNPVPRNGAPRVLTPTTQEIVEQRQREAVNEIMRNPLVYENSQLMDMIPFGMIDLSHSTKPLGQGHQPVTLGSSDITQGDFYFRNENHAYGIGAQAQKMGISDPAEFAVRAANYH